MERDLGGYMPMQKQWVNLGITFFFFPLIIHPLNPPPAGDMKFLFARSLRSVGTRGKSRDNIISQTNDQFHLVLRSNLASCFACTLISGTATLSQRTPLNVDPNVYSISDATPS